MSRRLLDYNPETHGAEGNLLLFGVPTHPPPRPPRELGVLESANAFLAAPRREQLAGPTERRLRRRAVLTGKTTDPQGAQRLRPRLVRAGQSVRTLLTPPAGRSDSRDPSEAMERV